MGATVSQLRTCYEKILECRLHSFHEGVFIFNWKTVWINEVPLKVPMLLWVLVRDKALPQVNLQKKGFRLAPRCMLCLEDIEDVDHLVCSCRVTSQIWNYFCFDARLKDLLLPSFQERLSGWKPLNMTVKGCALWKLLSHARSSVVWIERNKRTFERTASRELL